MNMEDYPKIYQIPIGTKVTIKESKSIPQIAGKVATICGWVDPKAFGSSLMLMLEDPVYLHIAAGAPFAVAYQEPYYCQPNEVTIIGDVPDAFSKAFDEKQKENGGDAPLENGDQLT